MSTLFNLYFVSVCIHYLDNKSYSDKIFFNYILKEIINILTKNSTDSGIYCNYNSYSE